MVDALSAVSLSPYRRLGNPPRRHLFYSENDAVEYDNTNTGLLARNQRRETEKHPEFTGSINIEGREYWLSAWVREGKAGGKLEGQKFFSLAVKPKDAQPAPKAVAEQPEFDDDVPF
jgi:hypothetical protein